MLYYFQSNVILLSFECYITFIGMLYYFPSSVILLLKGSSITSQANCNYFPREIKKLQEGNQANSQAKSINSKKEIQSNLNPILPPSPRLQSMEVGRMLFREESLPPTCGRMRRVDLRHLGA